MVRTQIEEIYPGVFGVMFDEGERGIYVPIVISKKPGCGNVGRFIDSLLAEHRLVKFPNVNEVVIRQKSKLRRYVDGMNHTNIEWADATWNPVTGCTPVSEGCQNCYAKRMAQRLRGRRGYPKDEPFRVTLHEDRLKEPLRWRRPRWVLVCSMGDLFHEDVSEIEILKIFAIMADTPQHTYMVLTKSPERMKEILTNPTVPNVWLGVTRRLLMSAYR